MIRVMSYNILFGGFDGDHGRRFDLQVSSSAMPIPTCCWLRAVPLRLSHVDGRTG